MQDLGPTMAQQVAQAISVFQEQRTGCPPKAVTVVLSDDTLVVTLLEALTLNVTCREQPADFGTMTAGSQNSGKAESSSFEKLGIEVEALTPQVAEKLGVKVDHGLAITDVRSGTPADLAGLTSGMVITEADRQPVKTVDDLRKILDKKPLDKGVLLLVKSSNGSRFVVIQVESK